MKQLLIVFFVGFLFSISWRSALAAYCTGGTTGGNVVGYCQWVYPAGGAQGYCGEFNSAGSCFCGPPGCSCQPGGGTGCVTSPGTPPTSNCICLNGGHGGTCTSDGNACGTLAYPGTCSCQPNGGTSTCSVSGTAVLNCATTAPTNTPAPPPTNTPRPPAPTNTPVPPTNTPVPPTNTPIPPTPTPTPVIMGNIYSDPNDGSVVVVGSACTQQAGTPAGISVANASIKATKASSGVVSSGVITGSGYQITGLVSGATDYQVALTLPTPAPNSTMAYICGCPVTTGNDYLCQYSSISANGSPNFFVKQNTLTNAWWQTYGGSVYARDEIQSQIPVNTCNASGSCTSALIVGNSATNTSGFAVLSDNGVVRTTTDGSDAYVQSSGSRTTAVGAYAVGVKPGTEDYQFFYGNLSQQTTNFTSLAELKTDIAALAANTTGLFIYTGAGDLTIDKDSASVPLSITNGKRVVVFVPTNLQFSNTNGSAGPQLTSVPIGTFLMFIVKGNVTVATTVGYTSPTTDPTTAQPNLTGVIVADGQIAILSDGDPTTADRKFIGAGTFVAWDKSNTGNAINLQRNLADGGSGATNNSIDPAEVFVYRPDFVANFPIELKIAHYNWRELAPQK